MKKFYFLSLVMVMLFVPLLGTGAPQDQTGTNTDKDTGKVKAAEPGDLSGDPFFETARFIMTKDEIGIYKHLPDKGAREDYIEEFWKKRDPSPETEENENKEEFEERIRYANKWFKEHSKARGWDTERGRLLLQLGFPDRREFGEAEDIARTPTGSSRKALMSSKPIPMEIWYYYQYQLKLLFMDANEKGRLELYEVPSLLPYALEKAKFTLDLRDQTNLKHAFKFEAEYKGDRFAIVIPVKKMSFAEKDGQMTADFAITLYVYRDYKKVDEVAIPKTFSEDKEKLLTMKTITFDVPYPVTEKGKYYFDVVIEEKSSGSKFRDFVDLKL